jgi:Hydrogenase 4 membrane component (E)
VDSLFNVDILSACLGLIIITDLCLLASERQMQRIRLLALQGGILGLLPLFAHNHGGLTVHITLISLVFFLVKGFLLPYLLTRTHKSIPHMLPSKPYLGCTASVFAGLAGFALSLWLNNRLGISANPLFSAIFPVAFTTIITGIILIVTRKKALTQVFGYLAMENGIYLLGVPMAQVDSVWLELTILLDILVGVFVMGVAIHHLHAEFSSISVDKLSTLKD